MSLAAVSLETASLAVMSLAVVSLGTIRVGLRWPGRLLAGGEIDAVALGGLR